jgi:hypothetical protein
MAALHHTIQILDENSTHFPFTQGQDESPFHHLTKNISFLILSLSWLLNYLRLARQDHKQADSST